MFVVRIIMSCCIAATECAVCKATIGAIKDLIDTNASQVSVTAVSIHVHGIYMYMYVSECTCTVTVQYMY